MTDTVPTPIRELKALRAHTEGVKMPPAALAAVLALTSHIPTPPLDTAIANFQKALQECEQRPPEKHLAHILSRTALTNFDHHKALDLADIALYAAQWAYLSAQERSPYMDVPEEARKRYADETPTIIDLAINAGDAARSIKLGWDPYFTLIELAGRALAWSAKEAGDNK